VVRILLERWGLSVPDAALLLASDPTAIERWRDAAGEAAIGAEQSERVALIRSIYRTLSDLVPDQDAVDAWMTRRNDTQICAGRAPIDVLRERDDRVACLREIQRYLLGELYG